MSKELTQRMLDKLQDLDAQEIIQLRRLIAIRRFQKKHPDWTYYNRLIDERIGIDIVVEEQYVLLEYYRDEKMAARVKIDAIEAKGNIPEKKTALKESASQGILL